MLEQGATASTWETGESSEAGYSKKISSLYPPQPSTLADELLVITLQIDNNLIYGVNTGWPLQPPLQTLLRNIARAVTNIQRSRCA